MMHRNAILLLSALGALLLAAGCGREQMPPRDASVVGFAVSERIPVLETRSGGAAAGSLTAGDLTVTVSEDWLGVRPEGTATKASTIYTSSDDLTTLWDAIAVWAYNLPADSSPVSAWTVDPACVSGELSIGYDNESSLWKPATDINHSSSRARWFAVAPWTSAVQSAVTLGSIEDGTAPTLSYTVNSVNASDQLDLMVAGPCTRPAATDSDPKPAVPLSFSHALAGVRIKTDKGVPLTGAVLSGVYDTATLDLSTGAWSGHSLSAAGRSFSVDGIGSEETWDRSGADYDIVKAPGVFLMVPQRLPAGAKLILTVEGEAVEADLSGHEWVSGKLVTYRVAALERSYFIEIESAEPSSLSLDMDATGPVKIATVHSWSETAGGTAASAGWKTAGVYSTRSDAEAKTSPLSGWTLSATGDDLYLSCPSVTASSTTVDAVLQAAPERGTADGRWNLSNPRGEDAIVETANTYIINAPGWYRLPLVIGNGIKGGAPNTAAYPSPFVDYKGAAITSPYLHNSSSAVGTPTNASIVWEEQSVVTDLAVVRNDADGLYWLNFNVPAAGISQGCTVVSVSDGTAVMWSWLLWCTDYESGAGDVACAYNDAGGTVTFMPRNLGWSVEGSVSTRPGRDAWVRVESEDDASRYAVLYVRLANKPDHSVHAGHGPFFQWGRKDAMPPLTMSAATYNNTATTMTPADMIKNPSIHYGENYYPYRANSGYTQKNWWSASATAAGQDIKTVKTIYDPCPVGYTVPRRNAFDGLSGAWSSDGWAFDGGLFLPVTGRRKPDNTTSDAGAGGYYWSAIPSGDGTSRRLSFTSSGINLPSASSAQSKAGEESIRPAREE